MTNWSQRVPGGLASWITWKKPEPLAPLEMTIEAPGRIATDGEVIREFNAELFTERLQSLVIQKPDAITVSLLNSFSNTKQSVFFPDDFRLILRIESYSEDEVLKVLAKMLPETPVSLSSEVLPELMEYERTITTVNHPFHLDVCSQCY